MRSQGDGRTNGDGYKPFTNALERLIVFKVDEDSPIQCNGKQIMLQSLDLPLARTMTQDC